MPAEVGHRRSGVARASGDVTLTPHGTVIGTPDFLRARRYGEVGRWL
jgi:hypothetical protein